MLTLLAASERIGPPWLGFLLSLGVFAIALFAVWALYRRFVGK